MGDGSTFPDREKPEISILAEAAACACGTTTCNNNEDGSYNRKNQ